MTVLGYSIAMPSHPGKTLLFIPTYNEKANVTRMLEELRRHVPYADILFADDNSPDGTGHILDDLAKGEPKLTVLHRPQKLGIGSAHLDGIACAYEKGYDTLVTLDCDFTHSPSDLPAMIAASENAAITVGSRYLEEDSLPGWNMLRKLLTNVGHLLTVSLLGIHGDATGALRVYRLDRVPRAMFDLVQARGYAFFFESLFIAHQNGLAIHDVPIRLPARTYGNSKMNLREVQRSVTQLFTLTVAGHTNPAQFRVPPRPPEIDPSLVDPQGWDGYWEQKSRKSTVAYDLIASTYRNLFIKAGLNVAIRREFPRGARLLHAGCGSGQVDVDLHDYAQITAVDISVPALQIYGRENPHAFSIRHASILDLPFADGTFDGAYNLGVVEHFTKPELKQIFSELSRVMKPGGKLVVFWPHAHATSVAVLNSAHWVMNDVLGKNVRLHPPEVSLVHSEQEARSLLEESGFVLDSYEFGPRDLFVQAVVVAHRRPTIRDRRGQDQPASA